MLPNSIHQYGKFICDVRDEYIKNNIAIWNQNKSKST
jgi:hypothetical protein